MLHPDLQMSDAGAGVEQLRAHRQWVPLDAALFPVCRYAAPTWFFLLMYRHVSRFDICPAVLARLAERGMLDRPGADRPAAGEIPQAAKYATPPWL